MDQQNRRPIDYAVEACETIMKKFDAPDLPPKARFHYHQGVFLSGVMKTWKLTGDDRFFDYARAWVDSLVDEDGVVHNSNPGEMDDIQPGILLYDLYERTGEEKYRKAFSYLASLIIDFQRNPEGGFFHKDRYPNQMWLDGLYLGGPICVMYGKMFHRPLCYEVASFQALLMEEVTRDWETGLLYHAYDQSRKAPWSDPVTGKSPEFWGRAMGWVPLALLEELTYIPEVFAQRDELIRMLTDLLKALVPYQDDESGLWYQVVNRVDDPRNWLETSCSCLYTGGIAGAVRRGFLDRSYLKFARKGYEGIIRRLGHDENGVLVDNVCVGTGVGDLDHYYGRPTSTNDLHGMGAFILMCIEMEELLRWEEGKTC